MEESLNLEAYVLADNKAEALERLPEGFSRKRYFRYSQLIDDPDFLQKIQDDEQLTSDQQKPLKVLHWLKCIELNKEINITSEQISKDLGLVFDFSPPKELRSTLKSSYPSALNNEILAIPYKILCDKGIKSKASPYYLRTIDMNDLSYEQFKSALKSNLFASLKLKGCIESLVKFESIYKVQHFFHMSLDNLDAFEKLNPQIVKNPDFCIALLKKKFNLKAKAMQDLYYIANEFYKEVKTRFNFEGLRSVALRNILVIGMKLNIFEEALLFEYFTYHRLSNIYKTNRLSENDFKLFDCFLMNGYQEFEILDWYIKETAKRSSDFTTYFNYIQPADANRMISIAKLELGCPVSDFSETLPKDFIESVENSFLLKLTTTLQTQFTKAEQISLKIKMKNIEKLTIKIFELNPKQFYLSNNKEISLEMNTEGLTPAHEFQIAYNKSPFIVYEETVDLPTTQNINGVFIIQLSASNSCLKVLVKKGSLKYISKVTPAGHMITILNEDNEIVTNGGVYCDNLFFQITNENCAIIPFAPKPITKSIILTDTETFEFVEKFEQLSLQLELKCKYFVHEEQIIAGTTASILIHPEIYINDCIFPQSLVKSTEAAVTFTDAEGLTCTKQFKDLQTSVAAQKSLDFIVPSNLISLKILITSIVTLNNEEKLLKNQYQASFNHLIKTKKICQGYLKRCSEGYLFEVIGRNGEPFKNFELKFKFYTYFIDEPINQTLTTDQSGKILLGKLKSVKNLHCSCEEFVFNYSMEAHKSRIHYPKYIYLCEGDDFSLPARINILKDELKHYLAFGLIKKGIVIKDCIDCIEYDSESSLIRFNKRLEKGMYLLMFTKTEQKIIIKLVDGVHIDDNNYIVSDSKVYRTTGQYSTIGINKVHQNTNDIQIELIGDISNAVVKVLDFNFLSNKLSELSFQVNNSLKDYGKSKWDTRKPEILIHNGTIDQEINYIHSRRSHGKLIGNTLAKPQILMKRSENNTRDLKTGDCDSSEKINLNSHPEKKSKRRGKLSSSSSSASSYIESSGYYEFLKNNALIELLQITKNHCIVPRRKEYSQMFVIIYNDYSSFQTLFTSNTNPEFKDLTLSAPPTNLDSCIEEYSCKLIEKSEEFSIENPENSYEIIDSIESLFNLQLNLIEKPDFNDWRFLTKWSHFTHSEKAEMYEKFASHELNLFIQNNDSAYFDQYIRPFVACKLQKTLIDKYLLNESLSEYYHSWNELNALEKSLFIKLLQSTDPDDSLSFAQNLKAACSAVTPLPNQRYLLYSKLFKASKSAVMPSKLAERESYRDIKSPKSLVGNKCLRSAIAVKDCGYTEKNLNDDYRASLLKEQISFRYKAARKEISDDSSSESSSYSDVKCKKAPNEFPGKPNDQKVQETMNQDSYYKKSDPAKEYIETGYFSNTAAMTTKLIPNSPFWGELGMKFAQGLSTNLSESCIFSLSSISEALLVLSFSGLPMSPLPHAQSFNRSCFTITPSSPILIFYKSLLPCPTALSSEILPAIRYFKPSVSTETKSFTTSLIYESILSLSNITNNPKSLQVLFSQPEGSIPILPRTLFKTSFINLSGFSTTQISSNFYFPRTGIFTFPSATISENGKIVSKITGGRKNVEEVESFVGLEDSKDFYTVVLSADDEKIFRYLSENNPYSVDYKLDIILFRLKDPGFYNRVIEILNRRKVFNEKVFSFSLFHRDVENIKVYLRNNKEYSDAVKYSPNCVYKVEEFPHFEYDPLISARSHKLGKGEEPANPQMAGKYYGMLMSFAGLDKIGTREKIRICQYYIYFNRLKAALDLFNSILSSGVQYSLEKPGDNDLQIQIDYMAAYLLPDVSSKIAQVYRNYPVKHWRKMFEKINEEFEGQEPRSVKNELECSLEFVVEDNIIKITYFKVENCSVNIFLVDLEVLFSKDPFFSGGTARFAYTKPSATIKSDVLSGKYCEIKIPEEFINKNMIIEVEGGVLCKSAHHFQSELRVILYNMQGVMKVIDSKGKPVPGAYIKVYSKIKDNKVIFYKDGHTDIRGKFDYVSLTEDIIATVARFSILVSDDRLGSSIVQVDPPAQ